MRVQGHVDLPARRHGQATQLRRRVVAEHGVARQDQEGCVHLGLEVVGDRGLGVHPPTESTKPLPAEHPDGQSCFERLREQEGAATKLRR